VVVRRKLEELIDAEHPAIDLLDHIVRQLELAGRRGPDQP
jgi:hypothetical protein